MIRRAIIAVLVLLIFATLPAVSLAQTKPAPTGKLMITVVDQSRLVIPNATVTIVGIDGTTKKATIAPAKSSDKGVATFEGLAPGGYAVSGEFPGFEIGAINDLRVKAGDNKGVLVLPLARLTEEITVGRDKQTVASDRGTTFGSALTREQIDALSDDPTEMARQLQDMAGTGATMRVDSFEGAQLPPKAMIKAIHITRDSFAAENHYAGGMFLDIITQPGVRPVSGSVRFGFYDSSLDGRNPLIPKKGPAQSQNYSANIGGTLIKDRSGYSISVNQSHSYSTPNLYAVTSAGTQARNLDLRRLNDNFSIFANLDYALTQDQTLRLSINQGNSKGRNLGVGAYDLIDRAYSTTSDYFNLRLQEAGPVGRRFFINTRFAMNWSDSSTSSATEAPTIAVPGAFTAGGAQMAGGQHPRTYSLQSDLDYVRGIQSWRFGISLDGGTYRSDDTSNYLGTYTFDSLDAYAAGLPTTFTRRIGDPHISYSNWQAGFYVQDDIRVSKNLTLSPGVRFEAQTHMGDRNNIGPRFGITWAPFKSGKTTLRASYGRFYDWLSSGTYEQTLRVDGVHQQELDIVNPGYPYDPTLGVVLPTNRYLLGDNLELAQNTRLSLGLDQQITSAIRFNTVYADTRGSGLLVGQNLNAPANGIRPNPALANIVETISAGRMRSRSLSTFVSLNLAPKASGSGSVMIGGGGGMMMISTGGGSSTGPLFSLRRGLTLTVNYTLAKSENNVDGAFSLSPTGTLATEWGPSNFDVRHRAYISLNSGALRNFSAAVNLQLSTGAPYTIRTGHDDNGDLMINDRPAGVGRNTERASGQWTTYGYFTYSIGFGKRKAPLAGGIDLATIARAAGISMPAMPAPQAQPRYRLSFSLNASNLTNHANYVGYNGIMTSPLFKKPTSVQGVRSFNLSSSFSF